MNEQPLFEETQRFRAPWLWLLLLPALLLPAVHTGVLLYSQLASGRPVGDRPLSNTGLSLLFAAMLVLGLGLLGLFLSAKLVVRVERAQLSVRFFPFTHKHFALQDVVRSEARDYRPLAEYGGWGIRLGSHGTAYTISGKRGVQLELRDGRRILLGSQRPEELAAALQRARGASRR